MIMRQLRDLASKRANDLAVIAVQSPLAHLTFGELSQFVDGAANALASRNVSPGAKVNIAVKDPLLALIVILGAAEIGARRLGLFSPEMGWNHHFTDDPNTAHRITADMLGTPHERSWPESLFPEIISATDAARDPEASVSRIRKQLSPLDIQRCTCLTTSAKGLVVALERLSLGVCVMLSNGRLVDDLQFMELFCCRSLHLDAADVNRYFGPLPQVRGIPGLVKHIVFAGPPLPETYVETLQAQVSNNIAFCEI